MTILRPKFDIVTVTKTSRGKFPGQKALKGTIGIVWSTWVSNGNFGTTKMSILDRNGEISFTTNACATKIGTIDSFPDLQKIYDRHVEKYFVPIVCILSDKFSLRESEHVKSVKLQYLGRPQSVYVKKHCICMKDLQYMHDNQKEKVFSLKIEAWVLERHGIA